MNNNLELFKDLNGLEFSEDEINDYITYNGVTVNELKHMSSMLNTKTSEENFQNIKDKVISSLESGERIEAYIKGLDLDMIYTSVALGDIAPGALLGTNNYSFNYAMFITNKRLFICDNNYYNEELNMKIYNLDQIEEIVFNREKFKKKKRTFKEWVTEELGLKFIRGWKDILILGGIYPVIVAFGSIINIIIGLDPINIIGQILSLIPIGILASLIRRFTSPKLIVKMRLKDGRELEFLIVNKGGISIINNCLKKLQERI